MSGRHRKRAPANRAHDRSPRHALTWRREAIEWTGSKVAGAVQRVREHRALVKSLPKRQEDWFPYVTPAVLLLGFLAAMATGTKSNASPELVPHHTKEVHATMPLAAARKLAATQRYTACKDVTLKSWSTRQQVSVLDVGWTLVPNSDTQQEIMGRTDLWTHPSKVVVRAVEEARRKERFAAGGRLPVSMSGPSHDDSSYDFSVRLPQEVPKGTRLAIYAQSTAESADGATDIGEFPCAIVQYGSDGSSSQRLQWHVLAPAAISQVDNPNAYTHRPVDLSRS